MINDCITPDQITAASLPRGPDVDDDGQFTIRQIDIFAAEFAANIISDKDKNPVTKLVNLYGDAFYDSNKYLNNAFQYRIDVQLNLGDYPYLKDRWDKGSISGVEFGDFLNTSNYTPAGFEAKARSNFRGLCFELDGYYAGSYHESILGGFCRLMPQIFGAVDSFFSLIGSIEGAIQDALEFLGKIRDLEDFFKNLVIAEIVKELINKIKEKITETIEKIFKKIEDAINNFDPEAIIGNVSTFINEKIVKNIMIKKERMCLFFQDDSVKNVKERVEGLIDYAVGLFENPNIEEIQFMIMRFCALAANIEALITDIKSPLDRFGNKYRTIATRLKRISNLNTSSAIRSGGIRYSDETKKTTINTIEEEWGDAAGSVYTNTGKKPASVKRITIKEYSTLPPCKKVKDGTDERVKISGDWVDDKDLGLEGWVNIDLDAKVYLMRIQEELDEQLEVTAAWRSQQYNKKIDGDPASSHMSGKVLDIKKPSNFDEETFTELALKSGFKGLYVYSDGIHLDARKRPQ